MEAAAFENLLSEEVQGYKALLETEGGDWIVKGFIDVHKNIYTMTDDTKVVSKILELILLPHLEAFASRNGLSLEFPSAQNFYPDITFKDERGNLFAVDFKSSYYEDNGKVNGMTLGSYWGIFPRQERMQKHGSSIRRIQVPPCSWHALSTNAKRSKCENRHAMIEALIYNFETKEKIDAEPVRQLELFAATA